MTFIAKVRSNQPVAIGDTVELHAAPADMILCRADAGVPLMPGATTEAIDAERWYETVRFGDGVTLIHEPWIKPFYRCNIWHVRGRDRDLLFDSGLGHFSLRRHVPLVSERKLVCVASHTHFDHIGCHHEFPERCVHRAEANILADPRNELTLADRYATDEMFIVPPEGWDSARYRIEAAPAGRILEAGDVVDLGDSELRSDPYARPFAGRHRALRDGRPASCCRATSSMTGR